MIELANLRPPGKESPHLAQIADHPITQWGRLSHSSLRPHPQLPKPNTEMTVVLMKSEALPLGFSLCGGTGSKRGDVGLYIRNITEGGGAFRDGRLRPGDELIAINGVPLKELSHKEAATMIRVSY